MKRQTNGDIAQLQRDTQEYIDKLNRETSAYVEQLNRETEQIKREAAAYVAQVKSQTAARAAEVEQLNRRMAEQTTRQTAAMAAAAQEEAARSEEPVAAASGSQAAAAAWAALCFLGGAIYLGIDWLVHDCQPFLTWRMKRALCNGELVPPLQPHAAVTIPTAGLPPLFNATELSRPVLLYGPPGTGKSAYARRVAWENVTGATRVPTAFVLARAPQGTLYQSKRYRGPKVSLLGDAERLAAALCAQLQFPTEHSWLTLMTRDDSPHGSSMDELIARERMSRALQAMDTLFVAADELYHETGQRPVLMFDEMQDLVREPCISAVGGHAIFVLLGMHAVKYNTVNFVALGSSSLFMFHWEETTRLHGASKQAVEMPEPAREDVYAALVTPRDGVAYTPEEANQILDACGCRVRCLLPALVGRNNAAKVIAAPKGNATSSLGSLFEEVEPDGRLQLIALLDAITRADAGISGARRPTMYDAPFPLSIINCPPIALQVLYVDPERNLHFQSEAHRRAWLADRATYVRGPGWA